MSARRTIISVFLLTGAFVGGYALGVNGFIIESRNLPHVTISRQVPTDKKLDFNLFWKVWDNVANSYYDKSKVVPSQMIYGAIKGMVASLGDPYTVFLTPSENKVTNDDLQGNFDGVGIQIGFKGDKLAVIAPLPKSPAEKAGIEAGDLIVAIKDDKKGLNRNTFGINLNEAVDAIRGPKGSSITLTIVREGKDKPFDVTMARDTIDVPSVTLTFEGENKNVAYIKLSKFGGETNNEWQKVVSQIVLKRNIAGIVLDLRNNPGGYLQSAVDVASEFLPVGSTAVIEQKGTGEQIPYKTAKAGSFTKTKILIVINKGSASASEILAGAMRDNRKIQLLGEISFGKGTVQEPEDLDNGSGLHITIAKWLTPNGTWVNGKGLDPDIKVTVNPDDKDDKTMQEAIKRVLE